MINTFSKLIAVAGAVFSKVFNRSGSNFKSGTGFMGRR